MSTPASLSLPPIYQGTTWNAELERATVPYKVREECGQLVNACSGAPVPDSDITYEDYTGCTAVAEFLRDCGSGDVVLVMTTDDGQIELDGAWMRFKLTDEETAELSYGDQPPAWTQCMVRVTVTRPNGEKEPQYELPVELRPWSTP